MELSPAKSAPTPDPSPTRGGKPAIKVRGTLKPVSILVLALLLVECQFQPSNSQTSKPATSPSIQFKTGSQQPVTESVHPLSGLALRRISLQDHSGNTIEILAEIADEPEARARGLMRRESLKPSEGMLFIFPEQAPLGFWMKNTLIPLDILFFDASGTWVFGTTMTLCTSDLCPSYSSQEPAKYALEIPAGSIEQWGMGSGWNIDIRERRD